MYAGRVRVLSGDYLLPEVHLTRFASTYLTSFRYPLLPGLREIRIFKFFEYEWTILLSLCSTKLKLVDLHSENENESECILGAFLHSLGCNKSHGLEKLTLATLRDSYVDSITKFHMLQDVQLWLSAASGQPLVEGFSKLSALNHLSRLHVSWEDDSKHHSLVSPLLPPHSVNFQSLHSIEIGVPTYIALVLVQCLRADTLKCIQVECISSSLRQPTSFRQIVDECGLVAPGLQEVDLGFRGNQAAGRETFDAVLNLTRRFRLRKLIFKSSWLEFDDAHIVRACLSHCFSHLEVLHLSSFQYGLDSSQTFQVLRSLATHCPLLNSLIMSLTVEKQHLPLLKREMENEHYLSHRLKSLNIYIQDKPKTTEFFANAESIPVLSLYLDSLFPSLDRCCIRGCSKFGAIEAGIRLILKGLQRRSAVDSRRLVGSQVTNL